ncbi:MAG: hypothetical protein J6Y59_00665 [Bacteroidaceae bacterium]|nr:hypothetical protein [Bacteroidaceae bacterium]
MAIRRAGRGAAVAVSLALRTHRPPALCLSRDGEGEREIAYTPGRSRAAAAVPAAADGERRYRPLCLLHRRTHRLDEPRSKGLPLIPQKGGGLSASPYPLGHCRTQGGGGWLCPLHRHAAHRRQATAYRSAEGRVDADAAAGDGGLATAHPRADPRDYELTDAHHLHQRDHEQPPPDLPEGRRVFHL